MLRLSGVPKHMQYTWKCVRAGKATALAAGGVDIPGVLRMGQWHSRAVLSYLDHDALDQAATLARVINESSDEEAEIHVPCSQR